MKQEFKYSRAFYRSVNERAAETATQVFEITSNLLHMNSIVDAGCGSGAWVLASVRSGIKEATGIDLKSSLDAIKSNIDLVELINDGRLTLIERDFVVDPISKIKSCDVAFCLEVAEHLPYKTSIELVSRLSEASDFIVFSAAQPGQGGTYHINEQTLDFWVKQFKVLNFNAYDPYRETLNLNKEIPRFYALNMLLFVRNGKELDASKVKDIDMLASLAITDFTHMDRRTLVEKFRYLIVRTLPVKLVTWLSRKFKY